MTPDELTDQLYFALKRVATDYQALAESGDAGFYESDPGFRTMMQQANDALLQYEVTHHHMPNWAVCANGRGEIKPGAQLQTRDGRRCGNAFVISLVDQSELPVSRREDTWLCLTDAGTSIKLTVNEINEMFWIGDYLANPDEVLKRFGKKLLP